MICTLSGCHLGHEFVRTMVLEPIHFAENVNEKLECRRYRSLASTVLEKVDPERRHNDDFARGFKYGFVDYMLAGGGVMPPPLPPRRYWRRHYQSVAGHQAVHHWFVGFEQGAVAARDGGHRDLVTVPSSVAYMEPQEWHDVHSFLPLMESTDNETSLETEPLPPPEPMSEFVAPARNTVETEKTWQKIRQFATSIATFERRSMPALPMSRVDQQGTEGLKDEGGLSVSSLSQQSMRRLPPVEQH